jgi:hypothetical protein
METVLEHVLTKHFKFCGTMMSEANMMGQLMEETAQQTHPHGPVVPQRESAILQILAVVPDMFLRSLEGCSTGQTRPHADEPRQVELQAVMQSGAPKVSTCTPLAVPIEHPVRKV